MVNSIAAGSGALAARGRASCADSTTPSPAGMRRASSMTKRRCSSAATSAGASAAARVCARSTARRRSSSRATASVTVAAPPARRWPAPAARAPGWLSRERGIGLHRGNVVEGSEGAVEGTRIPAASCSPAVASSSIGTQRCTAAVSPSLASDARACWIDRRASLVRSSASSAWLRCASVRLGDFSTPLPRVCRAASTWTGEASAGNDHGRSAAVAWPTARASNRPARVVRRATGSSLHDGRAAHHTGAERRLGATGGAGHL